MILESAGVRFIFNTSDNEDAEGALEPIRRFYRQEPAFKLTDPKFIKQALG